MLFKTSAAQNIHWHGPLRFVCPAISAEAYTDSACRDAFNLPPWLPLSRSFRVLVGHTECLQEQAASNTGDTSPSNQEKEGAAPCPPPPQLSHARNALGICLCIRRLITLFPLPVLQWSMVGRQMQPWALLHTPFAPRCFTHPRWLTRKTGICASSGGPWSS